MKIQIHIDRLVLDGLPAERSHAAVIQTAVQAELERLFAEQGASPMLLAGAAVPALSTTGLSVDTAAKPAVLGREIAHAVHGALQQ
jgi:hypothetical protein